MRCQCGAQLHCSRDVRGALSWAPFSTNGLASRRGTLPSWIRRCRFPRCRGELNEAPAQVVPGLQFLRCPFSFQKTLPECDHRFDHLLAFTRIRQIRPVELVKACPSLHTVGMSQTPKKWGEPHMTSHSPNQPAATFAVSATPRNEIRSVNSFFLTIGFWRSHEQPITRTPDMGAQ